MGSSTSLCYTSSTEAVVKRMPVVGLEVAVRATARQGAHAYRGNVSAMCAGARRAA
jgi:hypothetical protein